MGYATANTQQPHALGSFLGKEKSLLKRPKKERSNGYRIKYPIRVVVWTLRFVLHIKIIRSNGSYGVSDLIRSGAYWTTPGSLKYNKIERNDSQETIRSRESQSPRRNRAQYQQTKRRETCAWARLVRCPSHPGSGPCASWALGRSAFAPSCLSSPFPLFLYDHTSHANKWFVDLGR